jgi:hypothetical protein
MDTTDKVDRPSHYAEYVIEPIDYIMENEMEYWRGNIIKYGSRAGKKQYDGLSIEDSEIVDLQKIKKYCDFRIQQIADGRFE